MIRSEQILGGPDQAVRHRAVCFLEEKLNKADWRRRRFASSLAVLADQFRAAGEAALESFAYLGRGLHRLGHREPGRVFQD